MRSDYHITLKGQTLKRLDSLPITRDVLYQRYVVEHRGVLAIARELRRRNDSVLAALHEYGFIQPVAESWLKDQYIGQGKSIDQLAAELGCGEANVRRYLRKNRIPIRYRSRGRKQIAALNDPAWLREQYVVRGRTLYALADEIGCALSSVVRALIRFDISRRHSLAPAPDGVRGVGGRYFTVKQRRAILTRDGFQCRLCEGSERLEAHHIIPVRQGGTGALENGITLCLDCHDSVQGKEPDHVARFQRMVQGSHS